MKLPVINLQSATALEEFDIWITPSLGEIRDTERFRQELDRVVEIFDALSEATAEFNSVETCRPAEIADVAIAKAAGKTVEEVTEWLKGLASVLFLVTGKSDNNAKCQLPLFLRDQAHWTTIPSLNRSRTRVVQREIPRVLKADSFMSTVSLLRDAPDVQRRMLDTFVRFVLNDEPCIAQLWAVGKSYAGLKELHRERDLLTPLVIFQVRGSVAASGGHEPEEILRGILRDWGLEDDVDFNLADAIVAAGAGEGLQPLEGEEAEEVPRQKTRAYDFILPFKTTSWTPKIFVQCQFYAGDSGSVSHKNVDQTRASRASVAALVPDPTFVEFLDGAGYFSSLNGDLKVLLSMRDPTPTKSFFQVRSAPIRFRRELQVIGFLTLLELEHAILRTGGQRTAVRDLLATEGYSAAEIERVIARSLARNMIDQTGESFGVKADRRELARRYLLIDVIACRGHAFDTPQERLLACLLVPGYGPFYGMKMDEAITAALEIAPEIAADWQRPESSLHDIRWLAEKGYIVSS